MYDNEETGTIYGYRIQLPQEKTRWEEFLEIMDEVIPWEKWGGVIEPYYPKGKQGRPPMGIEKMLRMYLLQIWFTLSDPATEDAITTATLWLDPTRICETIFPSPPSVEGNLRCFY